MPGSNLILPDCPPTTHCCTLAFQSARKRIVVLQIEAVDLHSSALIYLLLVLNQRGSSVGHSYSGLTCMPQSCAAHGASALFTLFGDTDHCQERITKQNRWPQIMWLNSTHCAHTGWLNVVSTFQWNDIEPMWNRHLCPVGTPDALSAPCEVHGDLHVLLQYISRGLIDAWLPFDKYSHNNLIG